MFARKHAPDSVLLVIHPIQAIKQRYFRLVVPYLAALILAIGCAAVARGLMVHDSIPNAVDPLQLLAHALLLPDLFVMLTLEISSGIKKRLGVTALARNNRRRLLIMLCQRSRLLGIQRFPQL